VTLQKRAKPLTHIKDLVPDPKNRRKHTPRNVGMIVEALHKVGTGRSIVIDENNEILAGNATIEAAGEAGITDLKVVEAKGSELVAVRRTGLSEAQKRDLALYDNRTAELADWDVDQLLKDAESGVDLSSFFYEDELSALLEPSSDVDVSVAERLGDVDDSYVDFKCGDLGGKVSRNVYEAFLKAYKSRRESADAVVLDDVLQAWLGLS
jgi:ParB-like chromosome segregation protein Spo0J